MFCPFDQLSPTATILTAINDEKLKYEVFSMLNNINPVFDECTPTWKTNKHAVSCSAHLAYDGLNWHIVERSQVMSVQSIVKVFEEYPNMICKSNHHNVYASAWILPGS